MGYSSKIETARRDRAIRGKQADCRFSRSGGMLGARSWAILPWAILEISSPATQTDFDRVQKPPPGSAPRDVSIKPDSNN